MHPPRDANTAQTYSPLQQACQWELNFTHTNLAVNHRVRHSDERKWWANAIQDLVKKQDHITVFARGPKSNWNRDDGLQPATCAAAAFSNQTEIGCSTRSPGFTRCLRCWPRRPGFGCPPCPRLPQRIGHSGTNLRAHTRRAGEFHSRNFCTMLTQIFSVFRNAKR
jgi:hypothetical protein